MLIEGKASRLLGSEAVDKTEEEDRVFPQGKAFTELRKRCQAEEEAMAQTSQREARDLRKKLNKIDREKNYGRRAYGKSRCSYVPPTFNLQDDKKEGRIHSRHQGDP